MRVTRARIRRNRGGRCRFERVNEVWIKSIEGAEVYWNIDGGFVGNFRRKSILSEEGADDLI